MSQASLWADFSYVGRQKKGVTTPALGRLVKWSVCLWSCDSAERVLVNFQTTSKSQVSTRRRLNDTKQSTKTKNLKNIQRHFHNSFSVLTTSNKTLDLGPKVLVFEDL